MWKQKIASLIFVASKGQFSDVPSMGLVNDPNEEFIDPLDEAFDSTYSENVYRGGSYFPPTHNTEDFISDDFENVSENMVNVRNVYMNDIEVGDETGDECGYYGCAHPYYKLYRPGNAVNGMTHNQGSQYSSWHNNDDGYGVFFSHHAWYTRGAWVADIENNPTIGFVRIWPSFNYHTWYHRDHSGVRVFINNVECPPIEYYNRDRILQILPWTGDRERSDYDETATLIFNCPEPVSNANTIRIKNEWNWLTFKEVQIFATDSCPTSPDQHCSAIHTNETQPLGCQIGLCGGTPKESFARCENKKCQCTSLSTKQIETYNVAKCNCPPDYKGDRCEIYIGNPPCDIGNPCNADEKNPHVCKNIFANEIGEKHSYKCYCRNNYSGSNCQNEPPCHGKSCRGSGDVHYTTFDGTYYDNMGFCQYVYTTNAACSQTWPIDSLNFDYRADNSDQDFFMIVGDQDHLSGDTEYTREISKMEGLQVYWRPRSTGVLYRFTTHNNFKGWIWEIDTDDRSPGQKWSTVSKDNIVSNMNFVRENFALRINGDYNYIYVGAGRNGDESWKQSNGSPVKDYLLKVFYKKSTYGYIEINASCDLRNDVCGVCGDYDNQPDFNIYKNYNGYGDRKEWERSLERLNFWDKSTFTKCPYTNLNGNPVPTKKLAARYSRKKRQTVDSDSCNGDYATIEAACKQLETETSFANCDLDKQEKITECIYDSCMVPDALDTFVCGTLSSYVTECNASGNSDNQITSWRRTGLCAPECEANSHFESCTAYSCWASVTSCEIDQDECDVDISSSCVEGCFCDDGYIFDGTNCIVNDGNQCQEEAAAEMQAEAASAVPCASAPCQNGGSCTHVFEDDEIVDYSCECTNEYTGRNCHVKLTIDSTAELLAAGLAYNEVDNLTVDDFLYHGCFCSRLANDAFYKGKAVSELDSVCRRLTHCEKCSVEDICVGESGYPFFIETDESSPYICDSSKNSECQQAQCECSVGAADAVIEFAMARLDSVGYASCQEKESEGKDFECCGRGNLWMLYNTLGNLECEVEAGVPRLVEIGTGLVKRELPGV